jgi:inorganic pyrophosphatase
LRQLEITRRPNPNFAFNLSLRAAVRGAAGQNLTSFQSFVALPNDCDYLAAGIHLFWGTIMRIDAISIGKNPPEDINVIVEVPVGGDPIKYEMDKEAGTLVVDRFLYTPMTYPGNYGFVPHTLSEDGDPIDVLIASTRPLVPGCVISVRPIGVLMMEDNSGKDEKIIAVPSTKLTLRYEKVLEYTDLPDITIKQIQHFFEHYKDLEPGKWVKIYGWKGSKEAGELILQAIERAKAEKTAKA